MKATDGRHFAGLDHLRALAAFMVVFWHFAHRPDNQPVPLAEAPELSLLDEGHVGVSLFMVLSGYLFARLIGDRPIDFRLFMLNRLLRLLPLLLLVLTFYGVLHHRDDPLAFIASLGPGLLFPNWPLGAWSIVVELQFYLLLPFILAGVRRQPLLPLILVGAMLVLRLLLFVAGADLQELAFYSLVGRMDQFLLGIFVARHALSRWGTASAVAILLTGYGLFTASGGFYESPHRWAWILLPTLEAVGFAALVAWYDHRPLKGRVMGWVAAAGDASYGIYLLHGLLVTAVARAVDSWLELDSIYEAFPFVLLFFVYMALLGRVTFQFIEQPFLRHRRSYFRDVEQASHRPAALLAKEPFKAPPRPLVLP